MDNHSILFPFYSVSLQSSHHRRKRAKMNYENEGLLHEMFSRQAKKTPDDVAVVTDGGVTMTFKELDEATDVLAMTLRIKGVKANSIVGIYMEKCMEYVVSYIAILKAGENLFREYL